MEVTSKVTGIAKQFLSKMALLYMRVTETQFGNWLSRAMDKLWELYIPRFYHPS